MRSGYLIKKAIEIARIDMLLAELYSCEPGSYAAVPPDY